MSTSSTRDVAAQLSTASQLASADKIARKNAVKKILLDAIHARRTTFAAIGRATGRTYQVVQDLLVLDEAKSMPSADDCVLPDGLALELIAAKAHALGYRLMPRATGAEDAVTTLAQMCAVLSGAGDLGAEVARDLADGVLTPSELAAATKLADQLQRRVDALRAALEALVALPPKVTPITAGGAR